MAEGQVYNIPEQAFPWFKEKMAQLGKKADKLVGEKLTLMVVGKHFTDPDANGMRRRMYEVFVACPEVKINGWRFVARIDHSQEAGNVVRLVPGEVLPSMYRTVEPECNHCGYRRKRRDTFVLRCDSTEEHQQIGSSCLRDFTGHRDAMRWAKLAELVSEMGTLATRSHSYTEDGGNDLRDHRYIDMDRFAQCAAYAVTQYGWVSKARSKETGQLSTHSVAEAFFYNRAPDEMTDDQRGQVHALASDALAWAQSLGDDPDRVLTDYEHNAYVVASSGALEPRHLGIAASIVGVYYTKNVLPAKPAAPRRVNFYNSRNQGQPGDVLDLDVTVHVVNRGANSTRHMFYDDNENLYVWFATKESLAAHKGKKVRIRCTVKTHTEYNGVKQTLINRVKLL